MLSDYFLFMSFIASETKLKLSLPPVAAGPLLPKNENPLEPPPKITQTSSHDPPIEARDHLPTASVVGMFFLGARGLSMPGAMKGFDGLLA